VLVTKKGPRLNPCWEIQPDIYNLKSPGHLDADIKISMEFSGIFISVGSPSPKIINYSLKIAEFGTELGL
jgi:hypothetical protein